MDRYPFFFPSFNKSDPSGLQTENQTSVLVDIDTKNYLYSVLHQCYENRLATYSKIWNGIAWFVIVMVVGGILYLCWKYRPTEEQKRQRKIKTQKLVLSKMREMQEMNRYTQPNGITFLPVIKNNGY